jgi:D-galactarolactone cycloisomerase
VHWFEEPISPEDLDGYVEVTRKLDMAVAGGENEFTKFSFRRILEKRAMDIVQPDVCAAGGITECKKIAALAQAQGVQCVPHAWGTAIGLAATMHFLASLPNTPPCLVPQPPMLEYEQTFNPFRDELSSTALTHVGGIVHVPTGPGLGIEINRAVLDKYRVA